MTSRTPGSAGPGLNPYARKLTFYRDRVLQNETFSRQNGSLIITRSFIGAQAL